MLVVTRVRSTNTKCTRGCGCNGHPAFPAPSDQEGKENFWQTSGAMSREIAKLCLPLFEILNPLVSSLRTLRTQTPRLIVPARPQTSLPSIDARDDGSLAFAGTTLPPATPADQLSSPTATQNLDLNCSNFQSSIPSSSIDGLN